MPNLRQLVRATWSDGLRCPLMAVRPEGANHQWRRDNKAIVGRWFEGFCGNPWNPEIIDELAASDMLLQYSLHAPRRGREDVRNFMEGFRAPFPDLNFWGAADLIAEGDYVVGRWEGGGTHTGPAFSDFLIGSLPAASGRKMRYTGTPVLLSRMARSQKRSVSTMASRRSSSLAF
jgi:hypothetical protein